jgi:hypothetical protein
VTAGGLEDAVAITVGVFKGVTQDRPTVLDACNTMTRDNPMYPVFLHDAQQGWDILVQQQFHIDLALKKPGLLLQQPCQPSALRRAPALRSAKVRYRGPGTHPGRRRPPTALDPLRSLIAAIFRLRFAETTPGSRPTLKWC